jgi:hypothetical protein
VYRLEVVPGGSEVAAGRHHMGAAGDMRKPQDDARIAAGVADHRDAVTRVPLEVRLRAFAIQWQRSVATVSEAHVAVRVDEALQREASRQFLGIRNGPVAPSVDGQPGVPDFLTFGELNGTEVPRGHVDSLPSRRRSPVGVGALRETRPLRVLSR